MSGATGREAVLRSAERAFSELGFDGARVDRIAHDAGVNKALIYYYFKSKEGLYKAVLGDLFSCLQKTIQTGSAAGKDPARRFFGMISAYFDFVSERQTYPKIIQREMIGGGKFLRTMAEHIRPIYLSAKQTIEEGIRTGQFHQVDPGQLLFSVVALIAFYFGAAKLFGLVTETNPLSPRRIALRKQEILDLLRRGVLTNPQAAKEH